MSRQVTQYVSPCLLMMMRPSLLAEVNASSRLSMCMRGEVRLTWDVGFGCPLSVVSAAQHRHTHFESLGVSSSRRGSFNYIYCDNNVMILLKLF